MRRAPTRNKGEEPAAFIRRSINYLMEQDRRRMGVKHGAEINDALLEMEDELDSLRDQLIDW